MWMFILLCSVTVVFQLILGVLTESLNWYTDSLHLVEHICNYLIVIVGSVLSKEKREGRIGFLCVFTVSLSIIIISAFLLLEVIHGLSHGHHFEVPDLPPNLVEYPRYLMYVSFAESVICLFGFRWYKREFNNRYCNDMYKSKYESSMRLSGGDFIHLFLDLSSLLVMVYEKRIKLYYIFIFNMATSVVMCIYLITTNMKSMLVSGEVLILGVCSEIGEEMNTLRRRVSLLDGVLEVNKFEYWMGNPGAMSGVLSVECNKDANVHQVKSTIESMCNNNLDEMCVEVDKKDEVEWLE